MFMLNNNLIILYIYYKLYKYFKILILIYSNGFQEFVSICFMKYNYFNTNFSRIYYSICIVCGLKSRYEIPYI